MEAQTRRAGSMLHHWQFGEIDRGDTCDELAPGPRDICPTPACTAILYVHSNVCHTCLHTIIPPQKPQAKQLELIQHKLTNSQRQTCPPTNAHTHPWVYTHMHTHQYILIAAHLQVPPWNHTHVHNLTCIQSATCPRTCIHAES